MVAMCYATYYYTIGTTKVTQTLPPFEGGEKIACLLFYTHKYYHKFADNNKYYSIISHFIRIFATINMKPHISFCTLLITLFALMVGCKSDTNSARIDLATRAHVDRCNKEAFLNRYHDPSRAIQEAYNALDLLHDSLPTYYDGLMRAYNNLAFDFYMLAEHDSAAAYIDSVVDLATNHTVQRLSANNEVELVIANLCKIRLLQRSCQIAESYQLLYDIERSRVLKHATRNYLYSYALMEYYITSLTLNYHYRNESTTSSSGTLLTSNTKEQMRQLLSQIEEERPNLRCDYSEDMSLNYALAHSYYRLASASGSNAALLRKAYQYLGKNLQILSLPDQSSIYHLANVFQLQAFIVADTNIQTNTYQDSCRKHIQWLNKLSHNLYPQDSLYLDEDYALDMFRISTDLFFQTQDPYQHLGAAVAAAEYCLSTGNLDRAYAYYSRILDDTTWHDNMAPKFEAMLYDGLIRMGYSDVAEDNIRWYEREAELLFFIRQNESADVMLQERLEESETSNHFYQITIFTILPLLVLMLILVIMYVNRSRRLRHEKQALQEAKRKDVERIANVETCLSVLRHDINPFLSYLQNKKLPPELRQEVLDQLLRTFANIKNWTNLSIPSGMIFRPSEFDLSSVFNNVANTCINVHDNVSLKFDPTTLRIWGDVQLTEILIRNLVNNALQHTQHGQVAITATIDEDNFAHIVVADTGSGMDEQTLEDLFRADKKIDPNAESHHGFGLILCKYIIKRHDDNTSRGCRIWAESQIGIGTSMHVRLALAKN